MWAKLLDQNNHLPSPLSNLYYVIFGCQFFICFWCWKFTIGATLCEVRPCGGQHLPVPLPWTRSCLADSAEPRPVWHHAGTPEKHTQHVIGCGLQRPSLTSDPSMDQLCYSAKMNRDLQLFKDFIPKSYKIKNLINASNYWKERSDILLFIMR